MSTIEPPVFTVNHVSADGRQCQYVTLTTSRGVLIFTFDIAARTYKFDTLQPGQTFGDALQAFARTKLHGIPHSIDDLADCLLGLHAEPHQLSTPSAPSPSASDSPTPPFRSIPLAVSGGPSTSPLDHLRYYKFGRRFVHMCDGRAHCLFVAPEGLTDDDEFTSFANYMLAHHPYTTFSPYGDSSHNELRTLFAE